MQQEGYSLPAPVLMAILSGKSIPWCWNLLWLLPHLPVAKDPERSQEAARESWQKHPWSSLGGNQGHNPTTNLVGSSWGLGNTFAGAKGQELETCSRKKPIHTHRFRYCRFKEQASTQQSCPFPAGPWTLRSSGGWPPLRPHKETTWQSREEPVVKNHVFLTLSTHFRGLFCFHWFIYFKKWERTKTTKFSAKTAGTSKFKQKLLIPWQSTIFLPSPG